MTSATTATHVVFVGEMNPWGANPAMALYHLPRHASGNRLREHLGMTDVDYHAVRKVNLCEGRWSASGARLGAEAIVVGSWPWTLGASVLVLLGAKVREAVCAHLGRERPAFFAAAAIVPGRLLIVCLPHPSGMCRLWNAPDARSRARAALASVWPEYRDRDRT